MSLQTISDGAITAILRRSGQAAPYQDSVSEWSLMADKAVAEEDVVSFIKEHITTAKRDTEDRSWHEIYWTMEKVGDYTDCLHRRWILKVLTPYTG